MIRTYREFMEMCLSNEYSGILPRFVDEKIAGFGTALDEKIQGIGGVKNLLKIQKRQSKGLEISWKIKPVSHYTSEDGNTAVFADDVYLTIKAGKEIMEMYLRVSVILTYHNNRWKVIHWHGSKPEQVESEKDTWGVVSWKQRAQELEQLVAEKTADLIKKNRELEIEAALERVRARAMAMHHSDELQQVAYEMRTQLGLLGQSTLETCAIHIYDESSDYFTSWAALRPPHSKGKIKQLSTNIPIRGANLVEEALKNYRSGKKDYVLFVDNQKLREWYGILKKYSPEGYSIVMKSVRKVKPGTANGYWVVSDFSGGSLVAAMLSEPDENSKLLLKRFANVFDLAYKRFINLKQAEAQTREAQIELAIERVRARALAMHHSEELGQLVSLLFDELVKLDLVLARCIIWIINPKDSSAQVWIANTEDRKTSEPFHVQQLNHPYYKAILKAWKKKTSKWIYLLKGVEKKSIDKLLLTQTELSHLPKAVKKGIAEKKQVMVAGSFCNFGFIEASGPVHYTDEQMEIISRFSKVFDQSYTRFLDLQRAEAQAREAQIEAALERVRSRSLAMHKSEELREVIQLVFEQLRQLNFNIDSAQFDLNYKESDDLNVWTAVPGQLYPILQRIPYFSNPIMDSVKQAKKSGLTFLSHVCTYEEKNDFFRHFFSHVKHVPEERKKYIFDTPGYARSVVFLDTLFLGIQNYAGIPYSDTENAVLKRFGKVFEQSYTRFLDLQKAEAQAREAQIEAALERVRSRTMGMHKSEDLKEVAKVLYGQLKELGFRDGTAGFTIMDSDTGDIDCWNEGFEDGYDFPEKYHVPYFNHRAHLELIGNWKKGIPYAVIDIKGQEKEDLNDHYFFHSDFARVPEATKQYMMQQESIRWSIAYMQYGAAMWAPSAITDEQSKILQRFAKVFEQTYTRFLDLQKAEAQAREAQIEAALERVRAQAMAMHQTEDLGKTIMTYYEQLDSLIDSTIVRCGAGLLNKGNTIADMSTASKSPEGKTYYVKGTIDMQGHPLLVNTYDHWLKQKEYHHVLRGNEIQEYYQYITNQVAIPENKGNDELYFYFPMFTEGSFYVVTSKAVPEDELQIFRRFSSVLSLTYRRFNDLQKAEAQAREAQIEAALERVRARTMGMQKSEDLREVVKVLYTQLQELGFQWGAASITIMDKDTGDIDWWMEGFGDGYDLPEKYHVPYFDHRGHREQLDHWKNGDEYAVIRISGDEKKAYDRYYFLQTDFVRAPEATRNLMMQQETVLFSMAYMQYGALCWSPSPLSDEHAKILQRFGKVFEQSYTRFIDLQKAEAQAREAQIEASLERVRSKTMAMHDSNDVGETVASLFAEFVQLGIHTNRCGIIIFADDEFAEVWTARSIPGEKSALIIGKLNLDAHELVHSAYVAWQAKQSTHRYDLIGESMVQYYDAINRSDFYPVKFDLNKLPAKEFHFDFFFPEGAVFAFVNDPIQGEHAKIMKRFAGVFGQTYRRYLDLQKAEAQAREAQIEAALEKVRSRTMAMQHSSELTETSFLLVKQVLALGIKTWGCAFNIFDEDQPSSTEWFSNEQGYKSMYKIPRAGVFLKYYEAAQRGESLHVEEFKGQACIDHYLYLSTLPGLEEEMKIYAEQGVPLPTSQYDNVTFFKYGYLLFVTYEHVPKAHDIFKRFAKVFEQTYTRFLDLKRAEAQALEATKRASVDRVRAEIASMRTVQDLDRITPLIWSELKTLGVPFMRCGVFIMDESHRQIQTFLSTPEGKAISSFHLPYDAPGAFNEIVDHWTIKKIYTKHWGEAEFFSVADALVKQGSVANHEQYMSTVPSGVHLHCLPFLQGMLYVGNTEPLREDELQLAQSLADAFSTAYARYEDFNKLEAAKTQVENTLKDLRAAQNQLVQSEKMASLGELTAGIAHEIQNPLNFVNNFSEVNKELLLEMEEAIQKGNYEEAIALGKDIAANQEKINHHGKRAEGIVKGMLQHSRAGSGKKELTDINALCDEYLRLSYHGLRAKDKSFNAKFETHLDDNLPTIEVMPQDIGRVVLNLINNAFYTVSEKSKVESQKLSSDYEPTVFVSTKNLGDRIEISVKDNGSGIPESIKEKIFQPFFTTKPTGQGTGLGLSLSYDIVKAHGGELKVETKENDGSAFIILLPVV